VLCLIFALDYATPEAAENRKYQNKSGNRAHKQANKFVHCVQRFKQYKFVLKPRERVFEKIAKPSACRFVSITVHGVVSFDLIGQFETHGC
jgi:hypothetical protein